MKKVTYHEKIIPGTVYVLYTVKLYWWFLCLVNYQTYSYTAAQRKYTDFETNKIMELW